MIFSQITICGIIVKDALEQISIRPWDVINYGRFYCRYDTELREDGRNDILAYGIAFCRKRCKVVVEKL